MLAYLTFASEALLYAGGAALLALPLLLLNVHLAPRLGLIDWPKARGVADEQIPIVGHSLVILTIGAMLAVMPFFPISPWFLTTSLLMALMGHVDDRKPLPALDKFFFQALCVVSVVYFDPAIHQAVTTRFGIAGIFWGAFFLMGLVNAVNFIDGIDGLAGLVLLTGCAGLLLLSRPFGEEQRGTFLMGSLMLGMLVPFLYLNVFKRRGFMGNVGSYFFSYVLGVLHLGIPLEAAGPLSRMSLSGLCFLIPIADAIMVILTRTTTSRSPFEPDKGHLHHRLVQTTIPLRHILMIFGFIAFTSMVVAVSLADGAGTQTSNIPVFVCFAMVAITALLIILVEKASRTRVQGYLKTVEEGHSIYFVRYQLSDSRTNELPTKRQLKRVEARVRAEIRVTDVAFTEAPFTLCIALRTPAEPLKAISSRLELMLQEEGLHSSQAPEYGEFIKVARSQVELAEAPRKPSTKRTG